MTVECKLVIGAPLNMLIKRITVNITLCYSVLYHSCLKMRKSVRSMPCRHVCFCRFDALRSGCSRAFNIWHLNNKTSDSEGTNKTDTHLCIISSNLSFQTRQKWSACAHRPRKTKRRLLWYISLISPASVDDDREGKWLVSNLFNIRSGNMQGRSKPVFLFCLLFFSVPFFN